MKTSYLPLEQHFDVLANTPRICMGTAMMGSAVDNSQSFAALDAYYACGGRFFDTAHIYAAWIDGGAGASERTLGAWVRERGVREDIVIATKGAHPHLDSMDQGRCGADDLIQDLSESCQRLGLDTVDLYWLHRDDPGRSVADIVSSVEELIQTRKVGAWGVSNWSIERITEALHYADTHGMRGPIASQPGWSLASWLPDAPMPGGMRFADEACATWHQETGFPMVAYSSQATGWFGKVNTSWARNGFTGPAPEGTAYECSENRNRLLRAADLADQWGCTTTQIALAWLVHQPFPVYPAIGTTKPDRIREAVDATKITLTPEQVRFLHNGHNV